MWRRFVQGCLMGIGVTFLLLAAVMLLLQQTNALQIDLSRLPQLSGFFSWVYEELNYSVYLFIALLGWFVYQLILLHRNLLEDASLLVIQVREQRIDLNITLMFGVGVIFTALGMRSALVYTLGGDVDVIDQGASDVLKRLVDGGILVALSTTIVGGVVGYLMRLTKLLVLGHRLSEFYEKQQHLQWQQLARYLADEIVPGHAKQP